MSRKNLKVENLKKLAQLDEYCKRLGNVVDINASLQLHNTIILKAIIKRLGISNDEIKEIIQQESLAISERERIQSQGTNGANQPDFRSSESGLLDGASSRANQGSSTAQESIQADISHKPSDDGQNL